MKRTIILALFLLIFITTGIFAQVYSSKIDTIPTSYLSSDWKQTKEYTLVTSDSKIPAENVQTKVKIAFTRNQIIIGVNANDPNIVAIKHEATEIDTYSNTDDRIEISIASKADPFNYYHLIVNSDGITFDSSGSNKFFNATNNIDIDKTDKNWNSIITINSNVLASPKVSLPPTSEDTWIIKICRKSSRENIPEQSLNNFTDTKALKWEKLYFEDSSIPFNMSKAIINSKLMELNEYKSSFIPEISNLIETTNAEIAPLLEKGDRVSIEEANKKLEYCNSIIRYYVGAKNQYIQLKYPVTMPFCGSFNDGNTRFYADRENFYPNNYSYEIAMAKGERKSFQFTISAWKDIPSLTAKLDGSKIAPYTKMGEVAYADLSQSPFAEIYGSNKIQDPILSMSSDNLVKIDGMKAGETRSVWITIDLKDFVSLGNITAKIVLNTGETSISYPLNITIWNFAIDTHPNYALPISDLGLSLGFYTGYITKGISNGNLTFEISNPLYYYRAVSDMSRDLLDKRITTARLDIGSLEPWINITANEFDKWSADTSVLATTLKSIYSTGIKEVILSEYPFGLGDTNKYTVYARALEKMMKENSWDSLYVSSTLDANQNNEIWINYMSELKSNGIKTLVFVRNEELAKIAAPYADVIAVDFKLKKEGIFTNKTIAAFYSDMSLEGKLYDPRQSAWDIYFNKFDKYIYYAQNNWTVHENSFVASEGEYGLNSDFRVYPSPLIDPKAANFLDAYNFTTVTSMRMESTIDGITDMLYIQKMKEIINKLSKNYKPREANEGQYLLDQFQKNILSKPTGLISSVEYEKIRRDMGVFINLNI